MFWTSLAGYETSFGLVSLLFPDVRCICIFFLFFLSGSGGSSAPLGDNVQLRENRRGNADRAALAAQRKWRSKVAGSRRITGFKVNYTRARTCTKRGAAGTAHIYTQTMI